MANQSYTEVLVKVLERLATIDERDIHQTNHLKNIDSHLEKINGTIGINHDNIKTNRLLIERNKNNIGWICKIGGGLGGLAIVIASILNICGVI